MATNWIELGSALSNMGEDDSRVLGRERGNNEVEVAWWSCGNIKIATLSGVREFTTASNSMYEKLADYVNKNEDVEIGLAIVRASDGKSTMAVVDSCDMAACVDTGSSDASVQCECSDEYDADSYGEVPEEVLDLFDIEY